MYRDFETSEFTKDRKLRKVFKEVNFLWTDFKKTRNEKSDTMKTRQAGEEESRRERKHEMMKKL